MSAHPGELSPARLHAAILAAPPDRPEYGPTTADRVLNHTARLFHTTTADLLSGSRRRVHCEARFVAWTLIRAHTALSWPDIARLFDKDHTTVMSGARAVLGSPKRLSWAHAVELSMDAEEAP